MESTQTLFGIRQKFVADLPKRKAELELLWVQLFSKPNSQKCRVEFRFAVHRLIGACDCFDYTDMSHLLRKIEVAIANQRPIVPTAIEATLWGFSVLITQAQSQLSKMRDPEEQTVPIIRKGTGIAVIEPDEVIRAELAEQLRYFRYKPILCEQFIELRPNQAFAVIADLQEVQKASLPWPFDEDVPLLVTAQMGSYSERIQAVHLGADAFFSKPLNASVIIEFLDRWLLSTAQEPYRVLLIDDDELVADFLAEKLRRSGMRVQILKDPSNLLEPLQDWHPDALVLDVASAGIEVAKMIRHQQRYIGLPIIFLSSDLSMEMKTMAIEADVDEYLVKGLHDEYLINVIEHRASRFRKLRALTERDSLTGLLNHTRIKERLALEIARAKREDQILSMAMIDIDFFKSVNDNYGHLIGDQVIKALSRLLRERFRATDSVGRYGGEEFAVILPKATEDNARGMLDQLRLQFQDIIFKSGEVNFQVTLSAGVATFDGSQNASQLNGLADQAMYFAKESGRNRVKGASDLPKD